MKNPFVSVIMPVRNEASFIKATLDAILKQTYDSSCMEIIVVDGNSTDGTPLYLKRLQKSYSNLILIDNPEKIVPTSLNKAIMSSKGEIVVRVDGHTILAPDYIYQCISTLYRTGADNVGGKMTAIGSGIFGEAVALATSSPFGVGGARFHYSNDEEWVDTVYLGVWRRDIFERIGLFDEELVRDQDDEFNYRLRENGGKILLSPIIKSVYTVRGTPKKLWKQYFQYGFWKVRVLQKHPKQMRPRQFVPPLFAFSLLVTTLIALLSLLPAIQLPFARFWLVVPLALIIVAYTFANLIASVVTASRQGWKYLPLLPVTYAILHLSYGLGFFAGLFKFWNRWGDKHGKVPTLQPKISVSP